MAKITTRLSWTDVQNTCKAAAKEVGKDADLERRDIKALANDCKDYFNTDTYKRDDRDEVPADVLAVRELRDDGERLDKDEAKALVMDRVKALSGGGGAGGAISGDTQKVGKAYNALMQQLFVDQHIISWGSNDPAIDPMATDGFDYKVGRDADIKNMTSPVAIAAVVKFLQEVQKNNSWFNQAKVATAGTEAHFAYRRIEYYAQKVTNHPAAIKVELDKVRVLMGLAAPDASDTETELEVTQDPWYKRFRFMFGVRNEPQAQYGLSGVGTLDSQLPLQAMGDSTLFGMALEGNIDLIAAQSVGGTHSLLVSLLLSYTSKSAQYDPAGKDRTTAMTIDHLRFAAGVGYEGAPGSGGVRFIGGVRALPIGADLVFANGTCDTFGDNGCLSLIGHPSFAFQPADFGKNALYMTYNGYVGGQFGKYFYAVAEGSLHKSFFGQQQFRPYADSPLTSDLLRNDDFFGAVGLKIGVGTYERK